MVLVYACWLDSSPFYSERCPGSYGTVTWQTYSSCVAVHDYFSDADMGKLAASLAKGILQEAVAVEEDFGEWCSFLNQKDLEVRGNK